MWMYAPGGRGWGGLEWDTKPGICMIILDA